MPKPIRPDHLFVIADHTPGAHPAATDDITWWLPILGPTASWLAHLLARHATTRPESRWDTAMLAQTVGLGTSTQRLWASFERLDLFGVAQFVSTDTLTLRLEFPALAMVDHVELDAAQRLARRGIQPIAGGGRN